MDEVKINLSTKLMRGVVERLLAKILEKKLGYHIDIRLNELRIETLEDSAHIRVGADAVMDKDELKKLIESVK